MQSPNNKNIKHSTPNLIKGILTATIGFSCLILLISWLTIDYHLDQLIIKRTSEYAHSIARIAADSSAEALLSDDKLQLDLLVQNIAKDPFIHQATIVSENGQIISQYPNESRDYNSTPATVSNDKKGLSSTNSRMADSTQQFISRQKNKIFFEPITYQNITAGWFKLELDRYQLETEIRQTLTDIQFIISFAFIILLPMLFFIIYKFDDKIKKLASYCQHLLIQQGITPPKKSTPWLSSVKELSLHYSTKLQEHIHLPKKTNCWSNSRLIEDSLVCYLEFNITYQDHLQTAENLTLAEDYLNKSIQAFGLQGQGDLLSGCLLPISGVVDSQKSDTEQKITESLSLILLIRQLFNSLPNKIPMKAFIIRTSTLLLKDEDDFTTGITLFEESIKKIKQLSLHTNFDDTICLSIEASLLTPHAETTPILINNEIAKRQFLLTNFSNEIQQQIARKAHYLSK